MTETLDPLATGEQIAATYGRYLRTILPIRDAGIASAFADELASSPLTKGPLLEATPPYATGASARELIAEGVLDSSFAMLSRGIQLDRPLYRHQEQALRKAGSGRNLVVATGTGSGKTESFLYPVLNSLTIEHAAGALGAGVRALLLYPMNALANDQLKRLRTILADSPEITFGRYTGDTKQDRKSADEVFRELNPGQQSLPNELLSREEMRETPPHILLTNYAMLEYLLLRPADVELFHGGQWRYVVLDEAHVYDGAKAAEVAMLLRRLRDRVAPDAALRCIATSATVGDDGAKVADFASKLFDAPFDWCDDDPSRQDLVTATRVDEPSGPFWGPLTAQSYVDIRAAVDPAQELLQAAKERGIHTTDPAIALSHEAGMARLRERLAAGPCSARELAADLYGTGAAAAAGLEALVAVGSSISTDEGRPVLSARYHLFARASEGAFTCLSASGPHVALSRHEQCPQCAAAMFEFGTCKRCGAVHLVGSRRADGRFGSQPTVARQAWLHLGDEPTVVDEDEEQDDNVGAPGSEEMTLCVSCGVLDKNRSACGCNADGSNTLRLVRRVKVGTEPTGCHTCGARGKGIVRLFESGGDAAAAVLATGIYQAQPEAVDHTADQPGGGRKLLTFSDSRQAAAFFAPHLQRTYEDISHRRLILRGLAAGYAEGGSLAISDLVFHTRRAADAVGAFLRRDSGQQRDRMVALWIMQELLSVEDRQSLEGTGLLRVELDRDPRWRLPQPLAEMGLTEQESWSLLAELVRTVRRRGVLTMPDGVDPRDEAFDPRRGPYYLRSTGSQQQRKVFSWLPMRGDNQRVDYLRKVLAALGSSEAPVAVLDKCWCLLKSLPDGWLSSQTLRGAEGVVHQIDHQALRLSPVDGSVHRCDLCLRISPLSVRGVCPTMGCTGQLREFVPAANGDHYRTLYTTMNPAPMQAQEHTAQWTSEQAATIQQEFIEGRVNVLSCSTTFELGVDVGDLQSVLLRNMPPTTANYVQRAGRAGRRTDSAALVVSYAQRRSHDLSRYAEPESMIAGKTRAPYVPLSNERIDRRHAHSIALAAFFRHMYDKYGTKWRTAGDFFLGEPAPSSSLVRGFLTPLPVGVRGSLERVLPPEVRVAIKFDSDGWVDELGRLLDSVSSQLKNEVDAFEERRLAAFAARRSAFAASCEHAINTLRGRDLIGYLANHNILPKYGFPVDTVELRTAYSDSSVGRKLELSRDLAQAIYDYAPGAEVVAGGRLWRSGGVYLLPDKALIGAYYRVCKECGNYWEGADGSLDPVCAVCSAVSDQKARHYCQPEFGFVAEKESASPGPTAPVNARRGDTYIRSMPAESISQTTWRTPDNRELHVRSGSRAKLIALSEGPNGQGYRICDRCGAGQSINDAKKTSHTHLLKGKDCAGMMRTQSLAHDYQTDLMDITLGASARPDADLPAWRSVLYALLEGAADRLELNRDDIDGALHPRPGPGVGIALFDTVPGGAGAVLRIAERLDEVIGAACERLRNCVCGAETSCYSCLRGYRNQRVHDELSRGAALAVLEPLAGVVMV